MTTDKDNLIAMLNRAGVKDVYVFESPRTGEVYVSFDDIEFRFSRDGALADVHNNHIDDRCD